MRANGFEELWSGLAESVPLEESEGKGGRRVRWRSGKAGGKALEVKLTESGSDRGVDIVEYDEDSVTGAKMLHSPVGERGKMIRWRVDIPVVVESREASGGTPEWERLLAWAAETGTQPGIEWTGKELKILADD